MLFIVVLFEESNLKPDRVVKEIMPVILIWFNYIFENLRIKTGAELWLNFNLWISKFSRFNVRFKLLNLMSSIEMKLEIPYIFDYAFKTDKTSSSYYFIKLICEKDIFYN